MRTSRNIAQYILTPLFSKLLPQTPAQCTHSLARVTKSCLLRIFLHSSGPARSIASIRTATKRKKASTSNVAPITTVLTSVRTSLASASDKRTRQRARLTSADTRSLGALASRFRQVGEGGVSSMRDLKESKLERTESRLSLVRSRLPRQ
jgi:hypothetical protein